MAISHPTERLTAGDAELAEALRDAELPALLAAVAQVTGDDTLLRDDLRPDPAAAGRLPQGGLDDAAQERGRALLLSALARWRDGGCVPAPPPDPDTLRRLLQWVMGPSMGEYLPLAAEELALGVDTGAPTWTVSALAPGRELSVLIVGAGMSGLAAAHRLEQAGVRWQIVEKNADVGGTWLENTYPGCRVDIPNFLYSYSFAQKDDWPQHYSTQQVLLDYFRDVADEFGLRKHIRFGTEVTSARWADGGWDVTIRSAAAAGEEVLRSDVLVSAVGQLNRPSLPAIDGRESFGGPSFHSAAWDPAVDLTGRRVAVVGTGASALQFVPIVAEQAAELTVYQRTAPWLVPTPDYHDPVAGGLGWLLRHVPGYHRWYRFWLFCTFAEGILPATEVDPAWQPADRSVSPANELMRQLLTEYLGFLLPDEPELRERITPHYPPAAKRMLRDNGVWTAALRRPNVRLETAPIERITPTGIETADGVAHRADVIIWATGFQASRFLAPMAVYGRSGVALSDIWDGDARAYLGMTVPDFPNFFCLYGPNTNIVVNGSIIFFSEASVAYLLSALELLLVGGHRSLEVRRDVHDAYNRQVDDGNRLRAWGASDVPSWYKNPRGRVAQNWPFRLLDYWRATRAADHADYLLR